MTLDLDSLRLIATAARDVPMHYQGALIHFAQVASPATVLELVERVAELERGGVGTAQNFTKAQDALVAERDRLRAGLRDAIDKLQHWHDHGGLDSAVNDEDQDFIDGLRRL